ncbi:hypothetical protein ACFCZY_32650 [Streptomyces sp. NPDC056237]
MAALPLHYLRVVDQGLRIRETGPAEELNQVLVIVGQSEDMPVHGATT